MIRPFERGLAWAAWRRPIVLGLVAGATMIAAACANPGPPPGGRPDLEPPLVLAVSPTSMSTNQKLRTVRVRFDEVISETPKSARDLAGLVFISPKSGDPRVSWGRDHIDIRPSKGWKPNTVYSVQIKPGLADLRGNVLDTAIKVVFSTGGLIPDTHVRGAIFDWGLGRGMAGAVVEAMTPDSTIYQTVADSAGRFDLANIPVGPLLLRGYSDKNGNKTLDALETWDSLRITLTQLMQADLYAFQHDTVGLRIQDIVVQDSNRVLKVTFDKPYSPEQVLTNGSIRIKKSDSADVQVALVQTPRDRATLDSLRAKLRADSIDRVTRAKEDSTPGLRARNDSLARVRRADSLALVERTRVQAERIAAREAARTGRRVRPVSRDQTPPPKMNRPAVYTELFITLEKPLPPQTQFRLQVSNVRSLSEITKSPSRTFSTAREAKVDSTKTPPGGRPPQPAPVKRDTMPALFLLPGRP